MLKFHVIQIMVFCHKVEGFMRVDMYHTKVLKALESEDYISVRRRVLRQLVESLIYEGLLHRFA